MVRLRAVVEYDGTDYAGFQRQPNAPTIQAELEAALARLTQENVRILAAGRTDAGVHALGQVIAFETMWRHPPEELFGGMNALLPPAIALKRLDPAPAGFHPRFDARSRWYRYHIWNAPVPSPLRSRYMHHVSLPLDVGRMRRATDLLVGVHDFATFGTPTQGDSTIRQMIRIEWGQDGSHIWMDMEANAFLRSMARGIVGTALEVGGGAMSVEEFAGRFRACDRSQTAPPAPPQGLWLMAVRYPDGYAEEHFEGAVRSEDLLA